MNFPNTMTNISRWVYFVPMSEDLDILFYLFICFFSMTDVVSLERIYDVVEYVGRKIHGFSENMKIERFIWHTFNLYPFVQKVPLH